MEAKQLGSLCNRHAVDLVDVSVIRVITLWKDIGLAAILWEVGVSLLENFVV
jgi:hypothetical protein